jgi:AcrR family transcriptional regulator
VTVTPDEIAARPVRPMRADARRNYDALVAAAREVFAERGSDLAIEDVAKRAGVGVGTLYRHFPHRIDLVQAVYSDDIDTLVAAADDALADPDPWHGLSSWLEAFVAYAKTKRTFLNELHEAFERNPALRVELRERMMDALERVLQRAQEAKVVRDDLSASDVMQLVGGMCMSATARPGSNDRLLTVVLAGIRTG